ncbi:hypothetical protein Pmani_039123 [Petrolisthes manimaculis]|uniref:Uncharacterized protein n=1 Tax=Petrolisthes manimaculis TaxID=1843537 RepID=A0AAE1NDA2_9EUCA|nr:hypothetical protein Pmani_039123 [Petrolisthes manimaculis]
MLRDREREKKLENGKLSGEKLSSAENKLDFGGKLSGEKLKYGENKLDFGGKLSDESKLGNGGVNGGHMGKLEFGAQLELGGKLNRAPRSLNERRPSGAFPKVGPDMQRLKLSAVPDARKLSENSPKLSGALDDGKLNSAGGSKLPVSSEGRKLNGAHSSKLSVSSEGRKLNASSSYKLENSAMSILRQKLALVEEESEIESESERESEKESEGIENGKPDIENAENGEKTSTNGGKTPSNWEKTPENAEKTPTNTENSEKTPPNAENAEKTPPNGEKTRQRPILHARLNRACFLNRKIRLRQNQTAGSANAPNGGTNDAYLGLLGSRLEGRTYLSSERYLECFEGEFEDLAEILGKSHLVDDCKTQVPAILASELMVEHMAQRSQHPGGCGRGL